MDPGSTKRPIQSGGSDGEIIGNKKPKLGPDSDLRRVAEIVLALSSMAKIRGGKKPTEIEIGLMEEARSKLVELCEELPPQDIVGRDTIAAVIEDLGLNAKLKEQRLGFRGPKLSVAEKFALTKRKMDESKKYAAQNASYQSPPLKSSINATAETHGMPYTVHIPADKPSHAPNSTSGLGASPLVHVSTVTPTSAQYQLPTSEVRSSMVSSSAPGSHLGRDSSSPALPRVERVPGASNGSSYAFQVQENSSANHPPVNSPTWPAQTQSGPEHKVPNHTAVKVDGTAGMNKPLMTPLAPRDQNSRSFVSQPSGNLSAVHQSPQKIRFVQAPSVPNNHNEIAKIIQKLLQPQLPDNPTWIPPSRDYMSKALFCQTCQISMTEVDNVLICDACEKGYHISCAQSPNQRGIPRGEWHCTRCLSLSNGKPLPPKYGRVMRSNIQLKVPSSTIPSSLAPSSTIGVQMSSENKVGALDPNVYEQKISAHVSSGLQNPAHSAGPSTDNFQSATMQGNDFPSCGVNMDEKLLSGIPSSKISFQQTGNSESSTSDKRPSESRAESSDLTNKEADPKISIASETQENIFPKSSENTAEETLSGSSPFGERSSQQRGEHPADLATKDSAPNLSIARDTQGNNLQSSSPNGRFLSSERSSQEIDNSESSVGPPTDLLNKDADSNISNASEAEANEFLKNSGSMDEKPLSGRLLSSERVCQQIDKSELSMSDKIPESTTVPPAYLANEDTDKSVYSKLVSNSEVLDQAGLPNCGEVPSVSHGNSDTVIGPDNAHRGEDSGFSVRYTIKKDDNDIAPENTCESSDVSVGAEEHTGFSSEGFQPVEWIGDSIQVVNEKTFYGSCRVHGVTYELQDHVLFESSHGKLVPSKLQSMWEDLKDGSKWVIVNSCYFPSDLPENVGHPSTFESNEVFESNHEITVMAGLIQGPCEVLPLAKFGEENERRSQLGHETNNELRRPVFLCKWNYDEVKGLLKPVSQ